MQAQSLHPAWHPPTGTLGTLVEEAHRRGAVAAARLADLQAAARDARPVLPFAGTLRAAHVRVIAEVKRASPSKGAIAPGLDAAAQAQAYVAGGAAAISVLTEPSRFGGQLDDLHAVAAAVSVPAIRKDFIVHTAQLWEARAAGASAALLIVRALAPDELPRLMDEARAIGLATLVEVRDEAELARALAVGAEVIGVNNRNLETLVIDPATAPGLIPSIPDAVIAVAESGMREPHDVHPAAEAGADAILVGSAISAAGDPASAVRHLARVPRSNTRRTGALGVAGAR